MGTLEPGKYADFAVLEKDFFTSPVEEIPDMKVIMTGLSGEVVYDRDQLAGGWTSRIEAQNALGRI